MTSIHFWCPHCHALHAGDTYWQVAGVVVCRATHQAMTLGVTNIFDEVPIPQRDQVIAQMHQATCAHYWVRIVGPGRTERCARCKLVRYQPEAHLTPQAYHILPIADFDGVWVDEDGEAWLGTAHGDWVEVAEDDEGEWIAAPANWRERVLTELGV